MAPLFAYLSLAHNQNQLSLPMWLLHHSLAPLVYLAQNQTQFTYIFLYMVTDKLLVKDEVKESIILPADLTH